MKMVIMSRDGMIHCWVPSRPPWLRFALAARLRGLREKESESLSRFRDSGSSDRNAKYPLPSKTGRIPVPDISSLCGRRPDRLRESHFQRDSACHPSAYRRLQFDRISRKEDKKTYLSFAVAAGA